MSTLSAFLHPAMPEDQEVFISDRFKDENGRPVPFVIRPVTEEESSAIRRQAVVPKRDRRGEKEFDANRYTRLFVIAGTVQPDLKAADLCEAYGVVDPELLLGKMLLAGEFAKLSEAISKLSGITEEAADAVRSEAKN